MTVNNPTEGELGRWRRWLGLQVHGVMAVEAGATPHAHVVFRARGEIRYTTVQKVFDRGHVTPVYDYAGAVAYATKGGAAEEFGSMPADAGRRPQSRPKEALERMKACNSIQEAYEVDFAVAIRYRPQLLGYYADKARGHGAREVQVLWFHGATGTGKSWEARRLLTERHGGDWAAARLTSSGFVIGYAGERGVLFDDFRAQDVPFHVLLQITDRYDAVVNVKGGAMPWAPESIIFTCPRGPEQEFARGPDGRGQHEDVAQLLRRLSEVRRFGADAPAPGAPTDRQADASLTDRPSGPVGPGTHPDPTTD